MLPKITGCEPIEIRIKDTISRRYYFPELFQLRGKKLMYLLSVADDNVTYSNRQTLGSSNVLALQNAYVTLVCKGIEGVNRIPLQDLPTYFRLSGISYPNPKPFFINREIDWPKSFVEFTSTTGLNVNESILIYAFYNDNIEVKKALIKPLLKVEDIEIPILLSGLRFNFPDNEKLRGKKIVKMSFPNNTTLTTTPNGFVNYGSVFITLEVSGKEKIKQAHPIFFDKTYTFDNEIILDSVEVDFPNSYVEISTVNIVAKAAAYIKVWFHD